MKKRINVVLVIGISLAASACSMLDDIAGKGAEANDEAIRVSLFTLCQGASVGSVKRQFNTPEMTELYNKLCKKPDEVGL